MRIKEVSKMTGLTERTIRYYESCGLVIPNMEMKDHRVWRDYSEEHARLLAAVGTLRRASFQLEEIAQLLSAPEKIPETVKRVRERVEATRAEAEKLCERLGQPDLAGAADIVELARQLEKTTSGFELPPSDRNFQTRGMDRYYRDPRSLSASLAARISALVCVLWLLSMVLVTCFYARDLGHQAAAACEKTLEAFFAEPERMAAHLPEVRFSPNDGFLTFDKVGVALPKGVLVLNEYGAVMGNDGFWTPQEVRINVNEHKATAEGVEHEELWLAVAEGKLCFMVDPVLLNGEVRLPNIYDGTCYRGFLTFRDAPHREGSFSSGKTDWFLPTLDILNSGQLGTFWSGSYHTIGAPYLPSGHKTGETFEDGRVVPLEDEYSPPLELLDGIESGAFRFDSDGILMGSCLRGAWQRDEKKQPVRFLLAAYGWNPLLMALQLLSGVYIFSLALFLLLGYFLWLALRRSLVRPLREWNASLGDALLAVSPEEFDYACRYRELRDLAALYLLRRQMQEASSQKPSTEEVDPVSTMDTALRKLLPLIAASRMDAAADYRTEGAVAASPKALEDALLALIREALPYGEQDEKLVLRFQEREGFILAEAEVRTKAFRAGTYEALWEGIYRLPGRGDAPGAKLRKAAAALPGSFCAVRKTRHGLCLTLGLPAAKE